MASKKITIELSLSELVAIRDIIVGRFDDEEWAAKYEPDPVEEGQEPRDNSYELGRKERAIAKRTKFAELYFAITGEPLKERENR